MNQSSNYKNKREREEGNIFQKQGKEDDVRL